MADDTKSSNPKGTSEEEVIEAGDKEAAVANQVYVFDDLAVEATDLTGDRGVLKKIITAAPDDAPTPPQFMSITAHYTGTLSKDGTKFDSSRDRGRPFSFVLGKREVIRGWEIAFSSMKVSERAIIRLSSDYGYGNQATGTIPAGASLDFDVEMLGFSKPQSQADQLLDIYTKKYQATCEAHGGEDAFHADIVECLKNLGNVHVERKEFDKAISCHKKALKMAVKLSGDDANVADDKVCDSLVQLGVAYCANSDLENSREYFKQATLMKSKQHGNTTRVHPEIVKLLSKIGKTFGNYKQYEDARIYYEKSLATLREVNGNDNAVQSEIAALLNSLGLIIMELKDYATAKHCFAQSVEIKTKLHNGSNHVEIAASLNILGNACFREENLKEAASYLEKAHKMQTACAGNNDSDARIMQKNLNTVRQMMTSPAWQARMRRFAKRNKGRGTRMLPVPVTSLEEQERLANEKMQELLAMEAVQSKATNRQKPSNKNKNKKKKKKKKK